MHQQIISSLKKHLGEKILSGREAGASLQTGLWNGFDEVNAPVSVRCAHLSDLQNAIRIAAEHDLPVSVLGGGHDWNRRSVCAQGITLDLRAMRQVSVNRERLTLTADGGARVKNAVDMLPDGYGVVDRKSVV